MGREPVAMTMWSAWIVVTAPAASVTSTALRATSLAVPVR